MTKENKGMSVFDFVHSRKYYGLSVPTNVIMESIKTWWSFQKFSIDLCKHDPISGRIFGEKSGLHINFVPKFKLDVKKDPVDGAVVLHLSYYARIKKTGIAAAFLTSGLSVAIGAGTMTVHIAEAKDFLQTFWKWFEGNYQLVNIVVLLCEDRNHPTPAQPIAVAPVVIATPTPTPAPVVAQPPALAPYGGYNPMTVSPLQQQSNHGYPMHPYQQPAATAVPSPIHSHYQPPPPHAAMQPHYQPQPSTGQFVSLEKNYPNGY
ncbi:hypothetical protein PPL_08834 [Heterostelium album PN500]|uniref:Uncharacterized protein n=1 Tax=Heterostelium pallidum (strain ATCC 26659 / Pp 5 / PN500) TaxID=670386 RepID=D3BJV4_HETP5|nr:hypothetical protein PPL_08834 [Heterostelium album PN500]EFA78184.1 hypothetical protein PPL_08834 [Heterostelium album PN500]|eukprot:XP_020430310.1 hypothetical protein PPL_08834 [Heterostelium album PN500]